MLFSSPPKATVQRLDLCLRRMGAGSVTSTSPQEHLAVTMHSHDGVVASMGDFAVVKQEIIHCAAEDFEGFLVVFHDGLVWRVGAGHHKRWVADLVEEHVMQASVGQHDADVMQVRRNQRRKVVVSVFV